MKEKQQLSELIKEYLSLDEMSADLPPMRGEFEYTKSELMTHGINPETARNGFECVGVRRVQIGPCVREARCWRKVKVQ